MDPPGGKKQSHLAKDFTVEEFGDFGQQLEIGEAGGWLSGLIDQEFHEQDVFIKQDRFWDSNAGMKGIAERSELHVPPVFFHQLLAVGGTALDGASVARVAQLISAFGVVGGGAKTAIVPRFVHLCGDDFVFALHHENRGLFATEQTTVHLIDDAFVEQFFETVRERHGASLLSSFRFCGRCSAGWDPTA